MNLKGLKKAAILFAILVLPSIGYILLRTGKHQFKHLPFLGPKEIAMVDGNGYNHGDTIYHKIADFSFTNQEGKPYGTNELEGKIFVANFFFTTCQTICPKMTGQLYRVQEKFPALRELRLLSFTVDPENDSVAVLKKYAKQHMVNGWKWQLLTGDKKKIYDLSRTSFFAVTSEGDGGPDDFIHSDQMMLIDKEKHIRGIYDGTDPKEIDRLIDEIKVLVVEYKQKDSK